MLRKKDVKAGNKLTQEEFDRLASLYQKEHKRYFAESLQQRLLENPPEVEGLDLALDLEIHENGPAGDFVYARLSTCKNTLYLIGLAAGSRHAKDILLLMQCKTIIDTLIETANPRTMLPVNILAETNRVISQCGRDISIGAIVAALNRNNHAIAVANAGHAQPIIYRTRHESLQSVYGTTGIPLGDGSISRVFGSERRQHVLELERGDWFSILTKGARIVDEENIHQFLRPSVDAREGPKEFNEALVPYAAAAGDGHMVSNYGALTIRIPFRHRPNSRHRPRSVYNLAYKNI